MAKARAMRRPATLEDDDATLEPLYFALVAAGS